MTRAVHDRATAAWVVMLAALSVTACQDRGQDRERETRRAAPTGVALHAAMPRRAAPVSEPQAPDILVYRAVAPETAVALNAAMPVSAAPLVAARPFRIGNAPLEGRAAATDCMTAALFYEAAGEGESGEKAVAQVVLNRLRHPAFPKTVCAVVFQGSDRSTGCQFTFTCDGSLARLPSQPAWARARRVAEQALTGAVDKGVGLATHYHTQWVVPYWRSDLTKLTVIGAHIFYRWQGGGGDPLAFSNHYDGGEALPPKLAGSLPANYLLSTPLDARAPIALPYVIEGGAALVQNGRRPTADGGVRLPSLPGKALAADENPARIAADEQHGQLLSN